MKHVGKMKSNSAKVAVVFKTVPNEPNNALVVGTNGLPDAYHDALMSVIESDAGQQAHELADVLAARRFPDGEVMLTWLHTRNHLKKVPTNLVLMTPNSQTQIPLDLINAELSKMNAKPEAIVESKEVVSIDEIINTPVLEEKPVTASDLRSMADKLSKQAAEMRRKADEMAPPKSKKKATVEASHS